MLVSTACPYPQLPAHPGVLRLLSQRETAGYGEVDCRAICGDRKAAELETDGNDITDVSDVFDCLYCLIH